MTLAPQNPFEESNSSRMATSCLTCVPSDHRRRSTDIKVSRPDGLQVRLSIVMPAYNEGRTIIQAVQSVLNAPYPCPIELIVVDDGSTDSTAAHLATLSDPRLVVHRHAANMGKGGAMRTGIALATGTHLLPFDADLEYSPYDVPRMLAPVMEGRADVVYGTRLFGSNTVYQSLKYALGNRALTMTANVLFDSYISDLHTCFKLLPLDMVKSFDLTELGFGLDTEITASVLKSGVRPFEVPISYHSRSVSDGKKINWRDGVECLRILGRVRMRAQAEGLPVRLAAVRDTTITLPADEITRRRLSDVG